MTAQRSSRKLVVAAAVVAVLGAGVGGWALTSLPSSTPASAESTAQRHHETAPVTKGDLVDTKTFSGSLGYGKPTGVPGAASGTLTWLPKPGQVVHRDEPLYAVDERPVRAMVGATPMWRTLERGRKGDDVQQLNENLAALGYDVAVDRTFGPRTERAVQRWQKDRGLEVTGTITTNDVVFVDGDVRVESVTGVLGQPPAGDLLQVTSTKRVVTATVPQRDAERMVVGTTVRLLVNGTGDPLEGQVVDNEPTKGDDGTTSVAVTISFDPGDRQLPAAASARIEAEGQAERDVLSVPVSALLAGSTADAFAVDVVRRDGTTKRVPVRVGFVASGRAAVTGDVAEGDRVVVP
ncbi:efflux RND transporter periplasmic adaptor subunit [Curtobacterium sp. SAFR-003]|uniref:efflux RND transporter periplasmic adaptor subunit n=1 Tax=Curtobacterium sp. SAFR-003 TaxID=3387276 RepID=UPI003F80BEFC